jgi:hypothetical protein
MTRLLLIVVCLAAMACGGEELCAPTGKYVLTDTAIEWSRGGEADCGAPQLRVTAWLDPGGRWAEDHNQDTRHFAGGLERMSCTIVATSWVGRMRYDRVVRLQPDGQVRGEVHASGPWTLGDLPRVGGCYAKFYVAGHWAE